MLDNYDTFDVEIFNFGGGGGGCFCFFFGPPPPLLIRGSVTKDVINFL